MQASRKAFSVGACCDMALRTASLAEAVWRPLRGRMLSQVTGSGPRSRFWIMVIPFARVGSTNFTRCTHFFHKAACEKTSRARVKLLSRIARMIKKVKQ